MSDSTETRHANEAPAAESASFVAAEQRIADAVFNAILWRQHIAPKRLIDPGPDEGQLERLFAAASAAPDHGEILPWRFVIIGRDRRELLAQAFAQALTDRDPSANAGEVARAREKAFRAPFLALAIVRLSNESDPEIPDVERTVSLGAALQNILVCATAMGFGSALTSGRAMRSTRIRALFALANDEQAVCFVNVGTASRSHTPRQRPAPSRVVSRL